MYKLSNFAVDDFARIYEYTWFNFGVTQADSYTEGMEACLETLGESPRLGRDCSEIKPTLRRFDYRQHAIFYVIRPHDIFILRILHQQMEPVIHIGER